MDHAKCMAVQGHKKFIEVPPGDNKVHQDFPENLEKGTIIHYRQPVNEWICLIASFASFLHAHNYTHHAAQLFLVKHKVSDNPKIRCEFHEFLTKMSPYLHMGK